MPLQKYYLALCYKYSYSQQSDRLTNTNRNRSHRHSARVLYWSQINLEEIARQTAVRCPLLRLFGVCGCRRSPCVLARCLPLWRTGP